MANFNYAELFSPQLDQKYANESVTDGIDGVTLTFIGQNVVKLPTIDVPGFKDHKRTGGWNRQQVSNTWQPYKLEHDRDVEFFVDAEDVDETNQVVSAANITAEFETTQAIPEWDKYTISTIFQRVTDPNNGVVQKTFTALDETKISDIVKNVKAKLESMKDKGVNLATLQIRGKITLTGVLTGIRDGSITITSAANTDLDAIELTAFQSLLKEVASITAVPNDRLYTKYDYTDGVLGINKSGDSMIQLMITAPEAIARPLKRNAIYLKGINDTDGDEGDGYTYRQRKYFDVLVKKNKADAVEFFTQVTP